MLYRYLHDFLRDVQPRQGRVLDHPIKRLVYGVVGTDEKVGTYLAQFLSR